jgi:hypothetical protein
VGRELILALLVSCHAGAARETSSVAVPLPSATASASALATARTEEPIVLRELPRVQARVVGKAPTRKLPFHGATGVTVAPDGKTFFIDASSNNRPGGRVVSDAHPEGVFFGTSEVHDARFSSDGTKVVVYNDEVDVATVLSVPDGAVLHDERRAKVARFDGAALVTWDGCQITRAGAPVGPKLCGGAGASDDARTWVVVTPEPHGRPLSMRTYDELTWIDARTGAAATRSIAKHVSEVNLSPKGDFVCFHAPRFSCVDLRGQSPVAIEMPATIDAYRLDWADDGLRFVAAPFHFDDLVVVDFGARTVRHIALDADYRWLGFLPGGRRVVAWDKGAWAIDVATGSTIELFPKTVEVGGLATVPGRDDRFFMGNEIGSAREWLEVLR